MLAQRLGVAPQHLIALADRHTRAVQAWLSSRVPGAETWQGQGACAQTTPLAVRLFNLALGFDYPADMPPGAVRAEVAGLAEFYAARGRDWMWWIGPTPQPPGVEALLAPHGLGFDGWLPCMVAVLPTTRPAAPAGVRTWLARGEDDLKAASAIRAAAFGFAPGVAASYFADMADDWLRGDPARLFLAAADDGPPLAMGIRIMGAGVPGVYAMATMPGQQRRGLGKAIMARLMADAEADGHALMVLTAGSKGYGLYRKYGFAHLFDYGVYKSGRAS